MTVSPGPERLQAWERRTIPPLLAAALLFLIVLAVPVMNPNLSDGPRQVLQVADVGIWLIFAIDYVTRLVLTLRDASGQVQR